MSGRPELRRVLGLRDLLIYGIVLVQPTAPMPLFGVVAQEARGHVATAVMIAMVAMLCTAVSYGRMASVYPHAGSAYTYVGRTVNPGLGFLTGWSMVLDYLLNPLICTIWCSKAAGNFFPMVPYFVWAIFFALLFTSLNLRGIEASARTNLILATSLGGVVIAMLFYSGMWVLRQPDLSVAFFTLPFYDPQTFSWPSVWTGTSLAVLTYIGFDGISTLSEEVKDPRRNILRATVLTCLITGILATIEVYAGQLIWPDWQNFPDVDTAYVHAAGKAGGAFLFGVVNLALLAATIGSGTGSQLASARLLYGMGREGALPPRFFGAVHEGTGVPRNNVLLSGALALIGAFTMTYQLGAELLNFGAFIAFMGVNAAAFLHFVVREKRRQWTYVLPPAAGFVICFYIWLSLRTPAKIAGLVWLALGIAYYFGSRFAARSKAGPA